MHWSFGELPITASQRRPAAESLGPGTVFAGRYQILATLGAGGMGRVVRAQELGLQRTVAIKLLSDVDERRAARFVREGQLAASLNHPGIVRVHGGGITAEDQPFLVMEDVEGARDLDVYLGEVDREAGLDALLLVAEAVAYAHHQGVVHRDLKPGNVLVDAQGKPRVCDFGLAWRDDVTRLTRSGATLGTPLYMAPEQSGFVARTDPAPSADVWSLGVMLYQLLTGELPFYGATIIELMSAIGSTTPRPAHEVDPRVSPALSEVCRVALERDPARRYPHAEAFAEALFAARRQAVPVRERWRAVGVGLALLAAAGLGAWLGRGAPAPSASLLGAPAAPRAGASAGPSPSATPGPDALEVAARLEREGASAPELYAHFERALAAAGPEERGRLQLALGRAAYLRAHFGRARDALAGLVGREATFLRGRSLGALGEEGAEAALRELLDQGDLWGDAARAALAELTGRPAPELLAGLRQGHPDSPHTALLVAGDLRLRRDRAGLREYLAALGPRADAAVILLIDRADVSQDGTRDPRVLRACEEDLERAARLGAPILLESWFTVRARLASARGDQEEAIRLLRQGLSLPRRRPGLYYLLGLTQDAAGHHADALATWRQGAQDPAEDLARRISPELPEPLRLRLLRAAGARVDEELPAPTLRWVRGEAARLPPAAQEVATRLLERAARAFPWWRLQEDVAALRAQPPDPGVLRLLGQVALGRERYTEARADLEASARLAPSAEVDLALLQLTCLEQDLAAGAQPAAALVARWPGTPAALTARALLAMNQDPLGAREHVEAALASLEAPTFAHVLGIMSWTYADRPAEAVAEAERGFLCTRYADAALVRMRIFARALHASQSSPSSSRIWLPLFRDYEQVFAITDHPLPRVEAAEYALLLGERCPYFQAARAWLQEAEQHGVPFRGEEVDKVAWRLGAARGLLALARGGSEERVLTHWRALTRPLDPRYLRAFELRFGHSPRLR
ncbi:MAG: protein kinase [Planctomycetota bacterium]